MYMNKCVSSVQCSIKYMYESVYHVSHDVTPQKSPKYPQQSLEFSQKTPNILEEALPYVSAKKS